MAVHHELQVTVTIVSIASESCAVIDPISKQFRLVSVDKSFPC